MSDCQHCPHDTGDRKLLFPPIKVVMCCHCAQEGEVHPKIAPVPGHGSMFREITYDMGDVRWSDHTRLSIY